MMIVRVSQTGQITIPAAARRKLGIKPKSNVTIEVGEHELIIRPMKSISDLAGILREHAGGKPGDLETERAVAEAAVARQVEAETGH
jgi:AbrB family looped-hinge helix DNA binding protein